MSRTAKPKLPNILVEDENIKRTLQMPKELDSEIILYSEFFTEQSGKKPRSQDDVMIGLLSAFLQQDVAYQNWKRDKTKSRTSKSIDSEKSKETALGGNNVQI